MQRHALLSRNKMEQECRATRRQRKYGNAPENSKKRQLERKKKEIARLAREKYLIDKYGRKWLESVREITGLNLMPHSNRETGVLMDS